MFKKSSKEHSKPQAWPLDKIDIRACAEAWGLDTLAEYVTVVADPDPSSSSVASYAIEDPFGLPIDELWINPKIVEDGYFDFENGVRKWLLHIYAHEVAHKIALNWRPHDIEFAATYCFLLARIPGGWYVDDVLRNYDVHETIPYLTPHLRGKKLYRYARRIAVKWGCELAENADLTAHDAVKIINDWEMQRRQRLEHRKKNEVRLIIALAALAGLCFWIWKITRPII